MKNAKETTFFLICRRKGAPPINTSCNYHNSKNNSFPFSDGLTVAKRKLKVTLEALVVCLSFPLLADFHRRILALFIFMKISVARYSSLVSPFHYPSVASPRSAGAILARVPNFEVFSPGNLEYLEDDALP